MARRFQTMARLVVPAVAAILVAVIAPTPAVATGTFAWFHGTFSGCSADGYWEPTDLAVDPSGTSVYVADTNQNQVDRFATASPQSNMATFGEAGCDDSTANGEFDEPQDVALSPDAAHLYVIDTRHSGGIQKLNAATGAWELTFPTFLLEDRFTHTMEHPTIISAEGVAVDGSGNVYVVYEGNEEGVVKYSSSGALLDHWGFAGFVATHVVDDDISPRGGIAVSPDGAHIYILGLRVDDVQWTYGLWDYAGSQVPLVNRHSEASPSLEVRNAWAARDVGRDSAGNLYVAETGHGFVTKYDASGNQLDQFGAGTLNEPSGVAVGPDDVVYVSDTISSNIRAFTQGPAGPARPDAQVATAAAGPFKGNDAYSTTVTAGQTSRANVARGATRSFYVRIQNDRVGGPDSMTVRGTESGAAGYTVAYFRGATNVTSQVRAGTYTLSALAPGASVTLRVAITARTSSARGSVHNVDVTVRSVTTNTVRDVVRARATRT